MLGSEPAMGVTGGGDLAGQLWKQVSVAFPDLGGTCIRLEQGGGDHLLLIVDEARVFRFPRPGQHGPALEIKVLAQLRESGPAQVPNYDIIDPAGGFSSYRLIPGSPLTLARFAALPAPIARAAIADAVLLLERLHALDPGAIETVGAWPRMWSAARFADRIRRSRLPVLADRLPALAEPIADFLHRFRKDRAPRTVVLHGDLVSDHLLVDEQTGRLSGIIDFSDGALGDPAIDFLGFWTYGERAATQAVAGYRPGDADPALLARSRNHFVRYRIDRLYEMTADGASAGAIARHAATLAPLLAPRA